ncbi:MAG TPA: antitoxin family protein [Verrucomicrobiales bacterium]|nr:antitoxin family protein [Verrucomicrobiales bacterium]
MSTMTAIYENGVFRPLGIVRLPEHTRVEAVPEIPEASVIELEKTEVLAEVRALRGSLTLPAGTSDTDLITSARMDKYGHL